MSRLAKKAINFGSDVSVSLSDDVLLVKGPRGEISVKRLAGFIFLLEPDSVLVKVSDSFSLGKKKAAMLGLQWALLRNAIVGVSQGYERNLEIRGSGYKVILEGQGKKLLLSLGFSHTIEFVIPLGISITVKNQRNINIKGIDKQLVGQVASDIRSFRPPEPYKGKGVRFLGEVIKLKEGKRKK